jgi:hypothetical protein
MTIILILSQDRQLPCPYISLSVSVWANIPLQLDVSRNIWAEIQHGSSVCSGNESTGTNLPAGAESGQIRPRIGLD